MRKSDVRAKISRIDFPILMATDDSKGKVKSGTYDQQQYMEMMRPTFETTEDSQISHKPNITVLSDSLATFTDDYSVTRGGKKYNGRMAGLLVKVDGQWKWKAMYEAGFGDVPAPGIGGSGTTRGHEQQQPRREKPKK
ncbi:hypothetical protein [Cystobacter ferrugineus]|nr:hypothetical protein [Cystobacter ferrugineus]